MAEQEPQTYGIPLEVELTGPDGEKILYKAQPKPDDFHSIGPESATIHPRSDKPCFICGEVHAKEGYPICVCGANFPGQGCGKISRIVWCGRCVECSYERFSNLANIDQNVVDNLEIFKDYVAWKRQQSKELIKQNKMHWET